MVDFSNKIGHHIIRLDEIPSTNSFLLRNKEYLKQHGTVVTAHAQTGGRGRAERKFVSLPGKNITFSVVVHSTPPLEDLGIYSLLTGISVFRALSPYTRVLPRLKWPNDVLVGNRKICGILLEVATLPEMRHPVLVIGIGINCKGSASDYPEDLLHTLTTLEQESSQPIKPNIVFQEVLIQLGNVLDEFMSHRKSELMQEWLSHSNAMAAAVQYETRDGWATGVVEGLTSSGYLLIRENTGKLHTHISGDVLYCNSPYSNPK
ncbi:MAG: biotin--[acetyl-CoA-carboxylase] ligase [SAR324 cluster bacterium]|nr:biotin--[acetyl-CoA-carboxylase] ligase [SAR324 cluster bacterium]